MQINDRTHDTRGLWVLAAVCALCQLAIAPNIALGNGRANFALVFAACIALSRGGSQSVVAGFFAGLFFDLSSTAPIGLMAFILTVCSYLLGGDGRNRMSGDFGPNVAVFTVSSLGCALAYSLAMLLVGSSSSIIDALVFRALPTAFLSVVAFLPFAYYFSRLRSGSSLSGGRFSRKGF